METQNIEIIEEVKEPVIAENMWYQRNREDRKNFEFLSLALLANLKRYGNTIINVNHFNKNCRTLYNNSNKTKLNRKRFEQKIMDEPELYENLKHIYADRIAACLNKGKDLEDHVDVRLEYLPAAYAGEVDCWKIVVDKPKERRSHGRYRESNMW